MKLPAGLALVLIACSGAVAGVYSVSEKDVYRNDVTQPTAFQNYVLTEKTEKSLSPTRLTCSEFRTNFYYLKQQLAYLKDRIGKAQRVVIRYPKTYDLAVKALFGKRKNITYEPCSSGREEILIKICTAGR